mgnify:FL=1
MCGDILNILKATAPLKMAIREVSDCLQPAEKSRFWTVSLCLHHTVTKFEYKYILYNTEKQNFIKNRKVSKSFTKPDAGEALPKLKYEKETGKGSKTAQLKSELYSSSEGASAERNVSEVYQTLDTKFDYVKYADFIYNRISSNILIGKIVSSVQI